MPKDQLRPRIGGKVSYHSDFDVTNLTEVQMISRFPICLPIYSDGHHLLHIWPRVWIFRLDSKQENVSRDRPVWIELTIVSQYANFSLILTTCVNWRRHVRQRGGRPSFTDITATEAAVLVGITTTTPAPATTRYYI